MADKIIQLKDSQGNNLFPVMTCNVNEIGGISITKLWENASPTSSFAAQTLDDELADSPSNYDLIAIEHVMSINSVVTKMEIVKSVIGVQIPMLSISSIPSSTGYAQINIRFATINSNGINFGVGYAKATDKTSYSEANMLVIPLRIYGIKGVA